MKTKKYLAMCLCICLLSSTAVYADSNAPRLAAQETTVYTTEVTPPGMMPEPVAPDSQITDSAEMEAALKKVKSRITIPANLVNFSYSTTDNGQQGYSFSWNGNDSNDRVSYISVNIVGDMITNFNTGGYGLEENKVRMPNLSNQQVIDAANVWLKKANPTEYKNIKVEVVANNYNWSNSMYSLSLTYSHNGIPVKNAYGSMNISAQDGTVSYFYCNVQGNTYTDASKAISLDAAKKAYVDKIGIKPVYLNNYDKDGMPTKPFLAYISANSGYYIDAITGDSITQTIYSTYYPASEKASANITLGRGADVSLTPTEVTKLNANAKLLKQDAAEKIIKDNKYVGLNAQYTRQSATLSESYKEKGKYIWNFNYSKVASDAKITPTQLKLKMASGDVLGSISASVDAETGEILSISNYDYSGDSAKNTKSYDTFKAKAETVLKDLAGTKSAEYKLTPVNNSTAQMGGYNYYFVRLVNGIEFPNDAYYINILDNGTISSYSGNYSNVEFPSADKIMTKEQAITKLFESAKLQLNYMYFMDPTASLSVDARVMPGLDYNITKLIYTLDKEYFVMDANTGKFIDYAGNPIVDATNDQYTDINGYKYEAEIKALNEVGVRLSGTKFSADQNISQADFLSTCNTIFNGYTVLQYDQLQLDGLYDQLIRQGILTSSEKKPTSAVTREQMVYYLSGFLKLKDYANLNAAFASPYTDVTKNVGVVAILKALGTIDISGTEFMPQQKVTRGEAMHYIYNYLTR